MGKSPFVSIFGGVGGDSDDDDDDDDDGKSMSSSYPGTNSAVPNWTLEKTNKQSASPQTLTSLAR